MIPMRYSEARGTLIYEKNLKSKISCQTPFNLHEGFEVNSLAIYGAGQVMGYVLELFPMFRPGFTGFPQHEMNGFSSMHMVKTSSSFIYSKKILPRIFYNFFSMLR